MKGTYFLGITTPATHFTFRIGSIPSDHVSKVLKSLTTQLFYPHSSYPIYKAKPISCISQWKSLVSMLHGCIGPQSILGMFLGSYFFGIMLHWTLQEQDWALRPI